MITPVVSSTALEVDDPVGPDAAIGDVSSTGLEVDDPVSEPTDLWDASRVVIGLDDGIPASVLTYVAASGGEAVMEEPVLAFIVVSVDPSAVPVLLDAARADPRVDYAEPDVYVTT